MMVWFMFLRWHVMVRVAEVDLKRKRIGLSMKNVK